MKHFRLMVFAMFSLLSACSGPKIEDYEGRTPKADIRQFLNGEVAVWGTFTDRSGDVDPRFTATLKGSWKGNTGTLEEHFLYSDGKKQTRVWHITMVDDHHFTATAADVVGVAEGAQYGNAINLKYTLTVEKDGTSHDLKSDDWIFLVDEKHAMNRNVLTKFGFKVGELAIAFQKK